MKRIVVIATSCSGKTTLARKISEVLTITHIELDELHWKPGWIERENEEFKNLVQNVAKEENWVVDGNYSIVRDILWSRATTIIWLNYSFPLVLYRSISRSFKRSLSKEIIFSGNKESFKRSFFSKESIILWVIKTHRQKKKKYSRLKNNQHYSNVYMVELQSQDETNKFLLELASIAGVNNL